MIFDIHAHVWESGAGSLLSPELRNSFRLRLLNSLMPKELQGLEGISKPTIDYLNRSPVDKAVLLAFDAPYSENGRRLITAKFVVENDLVSNLSKKYEKVLFGASVHPYRIDAISELERVLSLNTCLIKWLPSAQNIAPDSKHCIKFYEFLQHHKIPLLCHTGPEHLLNFYSGNLNDPKRLIPALKMGVTVIAAHCASRIFLFDRCYFKDWMRMALEYENFYGDLSAFVNLGRFFPLRRILGDERILKKVFYGSDYPTVNFMSGFLPQIGWSKYRKISQEKNPFTQSLFAFKAFGLPDYVFSNAEKILRL